MDSLPFFKILDVIKLKRESWKVKTINKSCFVLSCRISGKSLFYFDNRTKTARKGDILYIPCGSSYMQETAGEELIVLHLEAYSPVPNQIEVFSSAVPDYVCTLFEKCYFEFINKTGNYELRCTAILYEILAQIDLFGKEQVGNGGAVYDLAFRYLEAHMYDTDFSIEALCRETNISRSYFNRLFKEHLGMTPLAYINEMRINKAKILLKTGNYTNEEIAGLCGFMDVKYFYVVFKRLVGLTTRSYVRNTAADDGRAAVDPEVVRSWDEEDENR